MTYPARTTPFDQLVIPWSMRDAMLIHLLDTAPNEGVGLLGIAPPEWDGNRQSAKARLFVPGTNVERSPTRFTMDPREVAMALRRFDEEGLRLGAIVHSHLRGPATPSPTDLRESMYPDAAFLIVSFADQPMTIGAWRQVHEDGLSIVQNVDLVWVEGE